MLSVLGYGSVDDLIDAVIPADIRTDRPLDLPAPVAEADTQRLLKELAADNR